MDYNFSANDDGYVADDSLVLGNETYVASTSYTIEDNWAENLIKLMNEERSKAGVAPLTVSDKLMEGAMTRANEQPTYYSHTRPNGTNFSTIYDEVNYGWSKIAENINEGSDNSLTPNMTAAQAMETWMKSAGHRANILDPDLTEVGVGAVNKKGADNAENYWVQLFGTPGDGGSGNTGSSSNPAANKIYYDDNISGSYGNGEFYQGEGYFVTGSDYTGELLVKAYDDDREYTIVAFESHEDLFLAGNGKPTKIFDGSGNSTLWGGSGSVNDTIIAGPGAETFLFGKYDGSDKILGANSNDVVNLYNVTLDDVMANGVSVESKNITLKLYSGAVLSIEDKGDNLTPTFELSDGSAYQYDRSTHKFNQTA